MSGYAMEFLFKIGNVMGLIAFIWLVVKEIRGAKR